MSPGRQDLQLLQHKEKPQKVLRNVRYVTLRSAVVVVVVLATLQPFPLFRQMQKQHAFIIKYSLTDDASPGRDQDVAPVRKLLCLWHKNKFPKGAGVD